MSARDWYGAVEGGGTKFVCAVGLRDHVHQRARIETRDPEATMAEVVRFFAPHKPRLRAIGVGCFGPLELDTTSAHYGAMLATPKPGWSAFRLRDTLVDALSVPVFVDTDVNGAALAEHHWGSLAGQDPAVYVTVGTGVGVGVFVHGRPLHGLMHPELGHLRAHDARFLGICPFHGSCVEGLVSAPAIRARTGREPAALADDHPVWASVADTLAELMHTIVLAYSPRRIALGGGVLDRAGLLERVQGALSVLAARYVPRPQLAHPGIGDFLVAPELRGDAGLMGAFALAMGLGHHAYVPPL